jgi:outer membrane protein assembly factor BamB
VGAMQRWRFVLVVAVLASHSLRAADDGDDDTEVTWNGLHVTGGTPLEFIYPFDGRAPKVAATLHNHHDVDSPPILVKAVRVNGQPIDSSIEISGAGPLIIPPNEYALPSFSAGGVYDGRFGPPPAVGETKIYHFEFEFMLAPGAIPSDPAAGPTTSIVQDVKFTNLGDAAPVTGPNAFAGVLRVPPLAAGAVVGNPRVEVATPYSAWVNIPLVPVAGSSGTAFSFSQSLALRNDWYLRYSADGYESRVVWLGYYTFPAPPLDLTLAPASPLDADYRRATAITTATGYWRGAVSDSEGTFVVFPGQENWKATATDADARVLRSASRIAKYRFDGTKLWEHTPGWETWGGDMTADGRYVVYALTPIARSFYTPSENKLVLLDGVTGTIIWTKSAPPADAALGRKLDAIEVRFSPEGKWLAVGSIGSGQVTLFDRATGNLVWSAPNSSFGFGEIQRLVFSPDAAVLYAGSNDGAVRALRISDGTVLWRALANAAPELNGLSLSADGSWLAVGSRSQDVTAIRTADGLVRWQTPTQGVDAMLAPDGRFIVSDGGLVFATLNGMLTGATKATGIARFTPDGRAVVQLGQDLRVYDLGGKLLKTSEASGVATAPGESSRWAGLSRDGRYGIVLARDMLNPPEVGIAIYERRTASSTSVAPAIVAPPLAQSATVGTAATLSVGATGTAPLAYRWQHNGVDIPGGDNAVLVLPHIALSDGGAYTVALTNAVGAVTSSPVTVNVVAIDATNPARIANLSVLADVGSNPLIIGFTVGGAGTTGTKPLLVRGAGPALAVFGVGNPLRDPRITLFSGTTSLFSNDNWGGNPQVVAMTAQVGAFPFTNPTSTDASIPLTSVGGSFSVHLASNDGSVGSGMAEIYDGTSGFTPSTPRLINISARAASSATTLLTAGFVISGSAAKTVLMRAVGPTLADFGVTGALADPHVTLLRGGTLVAANDNWYEAPNALQIASAGEAVGAFALGAMSRDAAILMSLPPGNYSAQVSGVGAAAGDALVEVYEVP